MTNIVAKEKFGDLLSSFRYWRDDYNIKIAEHQAIIRKHRLEIESLKQQRTKVTDLWQGVLDIMRQLGY